jgi:hypothetical protein
MKFEGELEGRELRTRAARTDVSFDVLVRCTAGEFQARIVNLSGSGFRLQSAQALEPGWGVTLEVANMPPVNGIIRWARDLEAGGVFVDPVTL